MKATFRTPWERPHRPGYVPDMLDPYLAAVLISTLEAVFPAAAIVLHTADLGYNIVVDLVNADGIADVSDAEFSAIQQLVDSIAAAPTELCVFVAGPHPVVPEAFQLDMIPRLVVGPDVVWRPLPLSHRPALFADLRDAAFYDEEVRAINDGIWETLIRTYVEHVGPGTLAPATPLLVRADQNIDEALATLSVLLWNYPDTVTGTWISESQTVQWAWKGHLDTYTGPLRPGHDPAAQHDLSDLPDGYLPLGIGREVGDAVQEALGQVVPLLEWRGIILITGPLSNEARVLARSLRPQT